MSPSRAWESFLTPLVLWRLRGVFMIAHDTASELYSIHNDIVLVSSSSSSLWFLKFFFPIILMLRPVCIGEDYRNRDDKKVCQQGWLGVVGLILFIWLI